MKTAQLLGSLEGFPIGKILCIGRNYLDHIKELGNEAPESPPPASSARGKRSSSPRTATTAITRPNWRC